MRARLKPSITEEDLEDIGIVTKKMRETLLLRNWFKVKRIRKDLVYIDDPNKTELSEHICWVKENMIEMEDKE